MLRLGLTTLETAILISIIAVGAIAILATLSSMNLNMEKQKGLLEVLYVFRGCNNLDKVAEFVQKIYHVRTLKSITLTDGCKACKEEMILVRVVAQGVLDSLRVEGSRGSEILEPRRPLSLTPGYYAICVKYKERLGELVVRDLKMSGFITVIVLSPQGPVVYK